MKYFIISQPKSGTHLMTNLYRNLGIDGGYILFNQHGITMQPYRDSYLSLQLEFEFEESSHLIIDNKFGYGHLEYSESNYNILKDFNLVYLTRNYNSMLESSQRYYEEKNELISVTKERYEAIDRWSKIDGVFKIHFEDLIGLNYDVVDKLQNHLFGSVTRDSKATLDRSLAQPSKTKSSIRI